MRIFDNGLWHERATDLPALLPPEVAVERNGLEYAYFGQNIRQLGHLVFQIDQTISNVTFEPSSDDEGSDFDPDTVPSYDDTSDSWGSSSDGNSSSCDDEASVLDVEEQLQEWFRVRDSRGRRCGN
jgi:hypothetical protein